MSETWQDKPKATRQAWPFLCCSRKGGLVAAAVLGLVGAGFTIQSLTLTFGDVSLPGPGFFPFALGLLLIALSVAIFVMVLKEPRNVLQVEVGHAPGRSPSSRMCLIGRAVREGRRVPVAWRLHADLLVASSGG